MSYCYPQPSRQDSAHGAILVVGSKGQVRWADTGARWCLKKFFGHSAAGRRIPPKMARWLATLDPKRRPKSLIVRADGKHLLVSQRHPRSAESIVLWLEVGERCRTRSLRRRHGSLTAREAEVLHWVSQGKSNPEIGDILGIATATVNKHLERVYPKLGVENRTAAVNVAAGLEL